MDEFVQSAGGDYIFAVITCIKRTLSLIDFELQVTSLECLFRLSTVAEREALAKKWFSSIPSLIKAFKSIRESFFEVVRLSMVK